MNSLDMKGTVGGYELLFAKIVFIHRINYNLWEI